LGNIFGHIADPSALASAEDDDLHGLFPCVCYWGSVTSPGLITFARERVKADSEGAAHRVRYGKDHKDGTPLDPFAPDLIVRRLDGIRAERPISNMGSGKDWQPQRKSSH